MIDTPLMNEDHISQVPALQLLTKLGYTYLTPKEALELRGGKENNVILEGILAEQLRKNNTIQYKGEKHLFTENNIIQGIEALKRIDSDSNLIINNEKVYNLLYAGKSMLQSISGDKKSYTLKYIDWENIENNVFHVTEEFSVERTGTTETYRPDIVLFINGIPLSIIECKRLNLGVGKEPMKEAISQHIRNQRHDGIGKLYLYSQLLLSVSKNEAKYGTTGTGEEFWGVWKEENEIDNEVYSLINKPLKEDVKSKLFKDRYKYVRNFFDSLEDTEREVTAQDRAIYSLCSPERLMELTYRYILFDENIKKVARYQQYYCVNKMLDRSRAINNEGKRSGGVVWHTQGSGKSLTMVMLAKGILLENLSDYKIIIVTDRVDLDRQIWETFKNCGEEVYKASTGAHLAKLINSKRERVVTTVVDKFETLENKSGVKNESPNVFVLVDEGHRGQYGHIHACMKKVIPNGCFIAFTGTPIKKKEKNTIEKFGGLIHTYTISQAVEDKAVLPLLYEGRHVEQIIDQKSIDDWFEKITKDLTREQKADLKKKFSTKDHLNEAEEKIKRVAWDIGDHFSKNFKGTGLKAQLVASSRNSAIMYKKYLDDFGAVSSEVLITLEDSRQGFKSIHEGEDIEEHKKLIVDFSLSMKSKYTNEKKYNTQVIDAFKYREDPEIIIVCDKLLTGFDEPKNSVLYLARQLENHNLLQAIARVNRLHTGKDHGIIIDYAGILENLDAALDMYSSFEEFDAEDLSGVLENISVEVEKLPQRHDALWDLFKEVKNKLDEESYEQVLADEALRVRFHERYRMFSKSLGLALSSVKFLEDVSSEKIGKYKNDLKFFTILRNSVQKRYSEIVDFSKYEPKIQKLIDTYIGTGDEVDIITNLVNIFDKDAFDKELSALGNDESKAMTIASRTKKTIEEHFKEDPALYRKFSDMLHEVIEAYKQKRIDAVTLLKQVTEVKDKVINKTDSGLPKELKDNENAGAYYRVVKEYFDTKSVDTSIMTNVFVKIGLAVDEIINRLKIVKWAENDDVKNDMRNEIEDVLYSIKEDFNFDIDYDDMDEIMDKCLSVAKARVK